MNFRMIVGGLKSYLPIPTAAYTGTGGTTEGAYCYSIWLRHLVLINRHVPGFRPKVVAEIGPGDSIGLGLAALLGGARLYYGMDVLPHARLETNERVLAELVPLFRARAAIPGPSQFPDVCPRLVDYSYPNGLFDEAAMTAALAPSALRQLESALHQQGDSDSPVRYICPWDTQSVPASSTDLVISQGALQDMDHLPHQNDLRRNLETMIGWLRPGGVMSHHIELACPGGSTWNHHWAYGSFTWKLIRGNRPYYKNRVPLSEYVRLLEELGCRVVGVESTEAPGLLRKQLARPFRDLPDDDLKTRAALVVATKP